MNNKIEWKKNSLFPYWNLPRNSSLVERAKELRKSGVLSEVIFWSKFKNKKFTNGWDIDRQVIIGDYIVDFFIPELGLIIEIDGSSHDNKFEYDTKRNKFFNDLDLEIIHLQDLDVKQNLENVYSFVKNKIKTREEYLNNLKSL